MLTCGSVGLEGLHQDSLRGGELRAGGEPEDAAGRPPVRARVLNPPGLDEPRGRGDGLALADGDVLQEHHPRQRGVDRLEVEVRADGGLDVPLVHLEVEHGGLIVDVGPHQPQHLVDELLPVLGLQTAHLRHHIVHLHHSSGWFRGALFKTTLECSLQESIRFLYSV